MRSATPDPRSDSELIEASRTDDPEAFAELWRRHSRSGLTVARTITSRFDPEDLLQESFSRIYQALRRGGGPTGAFRPYLFTTIRNTSARWGHRAPDASLDALEGFEPMTGEESDPSIPLERSLATAAFRSLPTRWQEVLWYSEVERLTPAQIAPLLGMRANAVAALAYRAREGLRQSWVQAHLAGAPEGSACAWTTSRLGQFARGNLGTREAHRLELHLDECERCTMAAAEAREVSSRIALILLPLSVGTAGAAGYLEWIERGAPAAAALAMPAAITTVAVAPVATGATSGGVGVLGSLAGAVAAAGIVAAVTLTPPLAPAPRAVASTVEVVQAGATAEPSPSPDATEEPAEGSEETIVAAPSEEPAPSPEAPGEEGAPPAPGEPAPAPAPAPAPGGGSTPGPSTSTPNPPPSTGSPTPGRPTPGRPAPGRPGPAPAPAPGAPSMEIDTSSRTPVYPSVQGRANPGSTVNVLANGSPVTRTTANRSGYYATGPLTMLSPGRTNLAVRQSTSTGTSAPSPSRSVDLQAPRINRISHGQHVRLRSSDSLWIGVDSISGASAQITVDGSLRRGRNGGVSLSGRELGNGRHSVSARYVDRHGRVGPSTSLSFTSELTGRGGGHYHDWDDDDDDDDD